MTKSSAAQRMRLYRERRRSGMKYVRIPLHVSEIDRLIHGQLRRCKDDPRTDAELIQTAILTLVYRALGQE
jgi:hypothetical protein